MNWNTLRLCIIDELVFELVFELLPKLFKLTERAAAIEMRKGLAALRQSRNANFMEILSLRCKNFSTRFNTEKGLNLTEYDKPS
jgi:hypothetical protein